MCFFFLVVANDVKRAREAQVGHDHQMIDFSFVTFFCFSTVL